MDDFATGGAAAGCLVFAGSETDRRSEEDRVPFVGPVSAEVGLG